MEKNQKAKQATKKIDEKEQAFFISQITTTKGIIKRFSNTAEFSPTMLLNSLLSLVVIPYERAKKGNGERIFSGKLDDLSKRLPISPTVFQPIKSCSGDKVIYGNRTIYSFVNKFRNGIAHQNLSVDVDEKREVHITICNKFSCSECKKCARKKTRKCEEKGLKRENGTVIDFEIRVTVNELQKLALYIADCYLKAIS